MGNVFVLLSIAVLLVGCKTPTAPEIKISNGELEILYHRIYPVIDSSLDQIVSVSSMHPTKYGGKDGVHGYKSGENQFIATIFLTCDPEPYLFTVSDFAIGHLSDNPPPRRMVDYLVAEEVFVRVKGNSDWIKASCITTYLFSGLASPTPVTKIIFNDGAVFIPPR